MNITEAINDALSKILPKESVGEVSSALETMLDAAKADLEKEYDSKLQEAYQELSTELKNAEKVAEEGYSEAYGIITDLRNRLEAQKAEYDAALDEGYEEAYQMLLKEKGDKESVETELYAEYDKKLHEMREFMIDKVDEFLQNKGQEIYEQARRDVTNDPRLAERAVTLNKVVETVSDYLSDEDVAFATSSKLQESQKTIEELKGQLRLLESRNIRISAQNTKLEESVRQSGELLKEHNSSKSVNEKKEKEESARKVEGRGKTATGATEVIKEDTTVEPKANKDKTLTEGFNETELEAMRTLSGIKTPEVKK